MLGLFLPALATARAASKLFDESGSELDGLFSLWCDSDDESHAHPGRLSKARRGMPPAGRVDGCTRGQEGIFGNWPRLGKGLLVFVKRILRRTISKSLPSQSFESGSAHRRRKAACGALCRRYAPTVELRQKQRHCRPSVRQPNGLLSKKTASYGGQGKGAGFRGLAPLLSLSSLFVLAVTSRKIELL
jgi:hypothetical protein